MKCKNHMSTLRPSDPEQIPSNMKNLDQKEDSFASSVYRINILLPVIRSEKYKIYPRIIGLFTIKYYNLSSYMYSDLFWSYDAIWYF